MAPQTEYMRRYNAENSERLKVLKRANRVKNAAAIKEYRESRREEARQVDKEYRQENASGISFRRCTPERRANQLVNGARNRAKQRGQFFAVSEEHVRAAVIGGKCARTGRTFALVPRPKGFLAHPNSPSIDRIDSAGIYVDDNIQIVCTAYNIAKGSGTDAELLKLCVDILRHAGWNVIPPNE